MDMAQMDKLRVLLDYWIRHNEEHGAEFREWAEKAKGSGEIAVHDDLMKAHDETQKANTSLLRALEKLTGEKQD